MAAATGSSFVLDMPCAGDESAEVESASDESELSWDVSLPGDSIVVRTSDEGIYTEVGSCH